MFPCLWLIKFSIIAFYARLVWTTARIYRIVTYITYTILGCTLTVVIFYKTFNCYPLVFHSDSHLTLRHEYGILLINAQEVPPRNILEYIIS